MPVNERRTGYSVVEENGDLVGEYPSLLDARAEALKVPGRKVKIVSK